MKKKKMNTIEIDRILKKDIFTGPIYGGTFALDEFQKTDLKKIIYIVNLSPSWDPPGTHWCAVINMPPNKTIFFNSFGDPPPSEILNHLLFKNDHVMYTNKQVQSPLSQVCKKDS